MVAIAAVLVLCAASLACTPDTSLDTLAYPEATQLEARHGSIDHIYDRFGRDNCATSSVTYGVDDPVNEVVGFFTERGVELDPQPPGTSSRNTSWHGERDGGESRWAYVSVFPEVHQGGQSWKTLFMVSLAECDRKPDAEYMMDPSVIQPEENPKALLTNTGEVDLSHGTSYSVERRHQGRWQAVTQPRNAEPLCAFTSNLLFLRPGETYSQRISVCDRNGAALTWRPGYYRVTKEVDGTKELDLHAYFRVKR